MKNSGDVQAMRCQRMAKPLFQLLQVVGVPLIISVDRICDNQKLINKQKQAAKEEETQHKEMPYNGH